MCSLVLCKSRIVQGFWFMAYWKQLIWLENIARWMVCWYFYNLSFMVFNWMILFVFKMMKNRKTMFASVMLNEYMLNWFHYNLKYWFIYFSIYFFFFLYFECLNSFGIFFVCCCFVVCFFLAWVTIEWWMPEDVQGWEWQTHKLKSWKSMLDLYWYVY